MTRSSKYSTSFEVGNASPRAGFWSGIEPEAAMEPSVTTDESVEAKIDSVVDSSMPDSDEELFLLVRLVTHVREAIARVDMFQKTAVDHLEKALALDDQVSEIFARRWALRKQIADLVLRIQANHIDQEAYCRLLTKLDEARASARIQSRHNPSRARAARAQMSRPFHVTADESSTIDKLLAALRLDLVALGSGTPDATQVSMTLVAVAAEACGVTSEELLRVKGNGTILRVMHLVVFALSWVFRFDNADIGAVLGMHKFRVSHYAARGESQLDSNLRRQELLIRIVRETVTKLSETSPR